MGTSIPPWGLPEDSLRTPCGLPTLSLDPLKSLDYSACHGLLVILNLLFSGNDNNEEWEAELEGELNDYEMVNSKGTEEDPEWENQIQQMLDAEDKQN